MSDALLKKLRKLDVADEAGGGKKPTDSEVLEELRRSGVKFASSGRKLEQAYYLAVGKLLDCIVPSVGGKPVLHEGGVYLGTWLESTGTINAEILSRFVPSAAESTFALFADYQRGDGLMPYKVTEQGPAYRQIQMVTPLARSVWNHIGLNGADKAFTQKMYRAMARHDRWLADHRDTRGTGCVEAFCTFDTGHDLSPRFWHVPDTSYLDDSAKYDPDSPILPYLAPDLTANVYCQRSYMAKLAEDPGEGSDWAGKAEASLAGLMAHCYDEDDGFFYDVDRSGAFVRIQSDVLLRVLACEVGDDEFFASSLSRYLLNTRKFFAKYPFTSIAMDDPRFDPSSEYNTWGGTSNFLSLIRAPHAFEHHQRHVEFTWVMQPILSAMTHFSRFSQCVNPWTGREGFTETYSPSILCLLDYLERLCGILPRPDGELWFTGLLPAAMDHGEAPGEETAYSRTVDGLAFELANTRAGSEVYRDGELLGRLPYGVRAVTDRGGRLTGLVGMTVRAVEGCVEWGGVKRPVRIKGNERLACTPDGWRTVGDPGIVPPAYG